MTGTALREIDDDGRLRNWMERTLYEVYGAITRQDGRHNAF